MKKSRKLILALAVLVILGSALIYLKSDHDKEIADSSRDKLVSTAEAMNEEVAAAETGPKSLINIDPDKVNSIEFLTKKKKITFSKGEHFWIVNNGLYNRINLSMVSFIVGDILTMRSMETVGFTLENKEQWGISNNSDRVVIKAEDTIKTIIVGSPTPSKNGYYVQIEGIEEIYIVNEYAGRSLTISLDDIRIRTLPVFDPTQLSAMTIVNDSLIKIVPNNKADIFTAEFFQFMLVEPYGANVPVNSEKLSELLESMKEPLQIIDFIDSGSPGDYGIDNSSRKLLIIENSGNRFELLIGNDFDNNKVYGKMANEDQIFTLNKKDLPFLDIKPIDLTDRFTHIINIELVDTVTIVENDYEVVANIKREGEGEDISEIYFINGLEFEEKKFKKFYQEILYLLVEGEVKEQIELSKPAVTISFKLSGEESIWTRIDYLPYNDEFYAVSRDGNEPQFIIGRYQLDNMMNKIRETVITKIDSTNQ